MRRTALSLAAVLCLFSWANAQELTDKTFDRIRDYIVPNPEELTWRAVGWHPTLWDAVLEARKTEKPILLWAMNGHPLACT